MAFYMGLSNRYGGKYQSCNNMDESNWYESVQSSYSTQNSAPNRINIDTSMTLAVPPVFSSHKYSDSEPDFPHSSGNRQRPVHASATESLYLSEHMLTPVPIDISTKPHAQIYTPSSTPIPRTVHIHRPLYSSQPGHITKPVNTTDPIQSSIRGETLSPVHTNDEECFSNNNQASNFFSKNKPVATEDKGSITDTHTVFSSNKIQMSVNHDSPIDDIGYEMEETTANKDKKECSLHTPLNYSKARPLDCSIAKKKEGQKKSKKQRFLDETPEQREERLERIRNLALFRRSNETPEQRAHRLMVGRDRMKVLRDNETEEEKANRLQKGKMLQHQRRIRERLTETKEEKKVRLLEACDRSRQRRADETPEQRAERLRVTRDRLRLKRQNESPETRARRLKTVNQKKKRKYHQMSHEEKVMMRIREQEKKLMKITESDSDYKRQTRGKDVKYDTFEDDLEDALLQLHDGQIPYLNIPLTNPDLGSQRKTSPIDCLIKKEIEDPQPEYCQDDIDAHQDVKPVVSDLEKVISRVADNGNTKSSNADSDYEGSCSNL